MKIHHIGIVCKNENINNYFFNPKKKFTYIDKNQNIKLIIGQNKLNDLWIELIVPLNKNSTVYNYLKKNGPSIHHFAYYVKNINEIKKNLKKKKDTYLSNHLKLILNVLEV